MGKKKEDEGSALDWIVTFSDTMTLLMVFFILLFSMSTIDEKKEAELSSAFNNIFSGGGSNPIIENNSVGEDFDSNINPNNEEVNVENQEDNNNLMETINKLIEDKNLQEFITVEKEHRGVSVVVVDSLLFQSGRSDLKGESKEILLDISVILNEIDNEVIIEGHTDNVPINTYMFASNWELSTSRAVVVTRFLVELGGVNPTRISAQGYGEFEPIVANDTPENKARNRRVNILILNK